MEVDDPAAAECPICARGSPLDILAELPNSWITGGPDAPLPGYACVVAKRHVIEPFHLEEKERVLFWEDSMGVAWALSLLFQPLKMNYEIHGNTIPHLHMHLYPRFSGDPYQGGPITGMARFRRSPEELAKIGAAVRAVKR